MTGSGTLLDPYIIYDVIDLQNMALDLTAYYELANDIDASATVGWNAGAGFLPVGNGARFTGHFDGKGYEIDQLFINRPLVGDSYAGLFGYIDAPATIRNVGLTNVDISGRDAGVLVGYIIDGTVTNCYATGTVTALGVISGAAGLIKEIIAGSITGCYSEVIVGDGTANGSNYCGGLIGSVVGADITISDCYATGSVSSNGGQDIGGLIGYFDGDTGSTLSDCYATGAISGGMFSGGLIGLADGVITMTGCYATGNVGTVGFSGYQSGGFIGYVSTTAELDIDDCYSTGNVTGGGTDPHTFGGFIGWLRSTACTLTDCHATGKVTGKYYLGGFIGELSGGTITRCYSTGDVEGTEDTVGGFIGWMLDGTITRCFATGDVTGEDLVGGFVGDNEADIDNSYSRGSVTASEPADPMVGGFIGFNRAAAVVDNCYSTGLITATPGTDDGGFCGDNTGTITNCYWDTEMSGYAASDGGTGKTTAQMKTETTFTGVGWDFATIWTICGGVNNDYPCLLGVTPSCVLAPVVVIPTVTTDPATEVVQRLATLNGTLDSDGGEACEVRFQYGLTDAYGTDTAWQPGKITGNTFEQTISGLELNTTYHFRAQAKNSAGTASGADRTFTTQEAVIINKAYALSREEL